MNLLIPLTILGLFVLMVLIWIIANYNRMARLKQYILESWSDVDVELKRRYDLIPNLVETVQGYARHERETFERVMQARNTAVANQGRAASQASDENTMLLALKQLFALSESYPDLKADQHFLELQRELANTEDRIAAGRRFYNGNVRDMRQICLTFPTNLLASVFNFDGGDFFEIDNDVERVAPRVDMA